MGEWTFVYKETGNNENVPPPPLFDGNQKQGYTFLKDGICKNKLGYFKYVNGQRFFLGTKTKYKLENDSLKILNLTDTTWTSSKIYALTSDTLSLIEEDGVLVKYVKTDYRIDLEPFYDKIIVSSSGCLGISQVSDICIDRQGNVFFSGQYNNTLNGLYMSKIDSDRYLEFESDFRKADIKNMKENYLANWTDDETVTVTFVKDNKIQKTISDYGRQSPSEFYWAYLPVRYLYQEINMQTFVNHIKLPVFIYNYDHTDSIYNLAKSEGFFLLMELYNGKSGNQNFTGEWILECKDDNGETIKLATDGRYYRYEQQLASQVIDIGYNFIKENNIQKH